MAQFQELCSGAEMFYQNVPIDRTLFVLTKLLPGNCLFSKLMNI